jgi:hypothetical protein
MKRALIIMGLATLILLATCWLGSWLSRPSNGPDRPVGPSAPPSVQQGRQGAYGP